MDPRFALASVLAWSTLSTHFLSQTPIHPSKPMKAEWNSLLGHRDKGQLARGSQPPQLRPPKRGSPVVMSWRMPLTTIRAFLTGLPNLSITTPLMPRCT